MRFCARRIGPFPEIVAQAGGGELFSTDDELIQAMRKLQQHPGDRAEMGRRGYRACRERWADCVRDNSRFQEHIPDSA